MSHLHLVRPEEDAGARRVSRAWAGFGVVALTAVLVVGAFGVGARWGRGEPPAGGIGAPSAVRGSVAPARAGEHCPPPARWRQATPTRSRAGSTRSRGGRCVDGQPAPIPTWRAPMTIFWSIDRRADGTGTLGWSRPSDPGDGEWWGPFSGYGRSRRHPAPDRCAVWRRRLCRVDAWSRRWAHRRRSYFQGQIEAGGCAVDRGRGRGAAPDQPTAGATRTASRWMPPG